MCSFEIEEVVAGENVDIFLVVDDLVVDGLFEDDLVIAGAVVDDLVVEELVLEDLVVEDLVVDDLVVVFIDVPVGDDIVAFAVVLVYLAVVVSFVAVVDTIFLVVVDDHGVNVLVLVFVAEVVVVV